MKYKLIMSGDVLTTSITKDAVTLCNANITVTPAMEKHLNGRYALVFEESIEQLDKNVQSRKVDDETTRYFANNLVMQETMNPSNTRVINALVSTGKYSKAIDVAILAIEMGYRLGLKDFNLIELCNVALSFVAGVVMSMDAYLSIVKIANEYCTMVDDGTLPATAKKEIIANKTYPNGLKNLFAATVKPYYRGQRVRVAKYGEVTIIRLTDDEYAPILKYYASNGIGVIVKEEILDAEDLSRLMAI